MIEMFNLLNQRGSPKSPAPRVQPVDSTVIVGFANLLNLVLIVAPLACVRRMPLGGAPVAFLAVRLSLGARGARWSLGCDRLYRGKAQIILIHPAGAS